MIDVKTTASPKQKGSGVDVYWHAIRYRTVALYTFLITIILLTSTYLIFPEASGRVIQRISDTILPHGTGLATITALHTCFWNHHSADLHVPDVSRSLGQSDPGNLRYHRAAWYRRRDYHGSASSFRKPRWQ